jgi:NitT/TauT family transport system substrate-binding protein
MTYNGLTRSGFIYGIAGIAAPFVLSRRIRAQTLPKLRIAASLDQGIIGALYGVQSGLFRKYGVDVEVIPMGSGAAIMAAMLGGSLELGRISTYNIIVAHSRGIPVSIQAPAALYRAATPNAALVVSKDAAIRTAADLNGKTVAVPALGDYYNISDMAWIDANGGDSRTVKFVELPERAAMAAISSGRVDATNVGQPLLNVALSSGQCKILGYALDVFGKEYVATTYSSGSAYAAQNADIMARFRKGLFEANAFANGHHAEMIPLISKYSGVAEKDVAAMSPTPVGSLANLRDAHMFQPMIDAAVKYKTIAKTFGYSELIDPNALIG